MYKSNYVEFNKVYNFIEEIEDNYLFLSNVKYYKNPTIKNQEILKEKFSNYFKYEKKLLEYERIIQKEPEEFKEEIKGVSSQLIDNLKYDHLYNFLKEIRNKSKVSKTSREKKRR